MDKDGNLVHSAGIQMDKLDFLMMEQATEEIVGGEPKSCWKKALETTTLLVLGVGISSPLAGHHWRTA
jgi:hypothetical protein